MLEYFQGLIWDDFIDYFSKGESSLGGFMVTFGLYAYIFGGS